MKPRRKHRGMRRAIESSSSESFSSSISSSSRDSLSLDHDHGSNFHEMPVRTGQEHHEEDTTTNGSARNEAEDEFEPCLADSLQLPCTNGHKMSVVSETMSHTTLKSSLVNGPRTGPRKSVRMLEDIETSDIPIKIR